jgi:hypothetical protein
VCFLLSWFFSCNLNLAGEGSTTRNPTWPLFGTLTHSPEPWCSFPLLLNWSFYVLIGLNIWRQTELGCQCISLWKSVQLAPIGLYWNLLRLPSKSKGAKVSSDAW